MNSLPKTASRLNPGPSAPESSTLTTRLPSHPIVHRVVDNMHSTQLLAVNWHSIIMTSMLDPLRPL